MKKTLCFSVMGLALFSLMFVATTSYAFFPISVKPIKVEVTNDETKPVPVTIQNGNDVASKTFNLCTDSDSPLWTAKEKILDVPEDQMAVVEYASFSGHSDTAINRVTLYLEKQAIMGAKHFLAVTPHGFIGSQQEFIGNSPIRLYAKPSNEIWFEILREVGYSEDFGGVMCISGYYVDVVE